MANRRMPARAARCEVDATVVAAEQTGLREPAAERQRAQRAVVEPDPRLARDDRDRRRDGALGAHDRLQFVSDVEVAALRQPVGDQGALERHDGPA